MDSSRSKHSFAKGDEQQQRYLIAVSAPAQIDSITQMLKQDPEVEILETKSSQDNPVLVVAMTPSRAETLRQQSRGQFIIEKDQPLEMFGKDSLL